MNQYLVIEVLSTPLSMSVALRPN